MSEKQLKYGQVYGGENGFDYTITADQTIKAASAKFVKRAGASTATATLATASDTDLLGHLEIETFDYVSTDGTEVRKVVNDPTAVFKVPSRGTYAETMKEKKCDIYNSNNIQGADLAAATYGQLIIVAGDTNDTGWVLVRLNPAVLNKSSVA